MVIGASLCYAHRTSGIPYNRTLIRFQSCPVVIRSKLPHGGCPLKACLPFMVLTTVGGAAGESHSGSYKPFLYRSLHAFPLWSTTTFTRGLLTRRRLLLSTGFLTGGPKASLPFHRCLHTWPTEVGLVAIVSPEGDHP